MEGATMGRAASRSPAAFFDTGVLKWGIKSTREIDARQDPDQKKAWIKAQVRAVGLLVEAARHAKLTICHEVESVVEMMHSTNAMASKRINALLAGVSLKGIPSPFEHSRLLAGFGVTKESADKDREEMLDFAIANYPRMKEIHEAIGGNKKADAYHIWAAESAGVDFFVSMDEKLVNSVRHQKKIRFRTEILYPAELVNQLVFEGTGFAER